MIRRLIQVCALILNKILAEEASILNGATVGTYELDSTYSWNDIAICDGNFKDMMTSTTDNNNNG